MIWTIALSTGLAGYALVTGICAVIAYREPHGYDY